MPIRALATSAAQLTPVASSWAGSWRLSGIGIVTSHGVGGCNPSDAGSTLSGNECAIRSTSCHLFGESLSSHLMDAGGEIAVLVHEMHGVVADLDQEFQVLLVGGVQGPEGQ